mmetsp:Transcript_136618/g.354163  ORF Transcript_136618/g.354163 Transcript_136618/m.354163 type:complete len:254 (-) Transcript_136618:231-992(-)
MQDVAQHALHSSSQLVGVPEVLVIQWLPIPLGPDFLELVRLGSQQAEPTAIDGVVLQEAVKVQKDLLLLILLRLACGQRSPPGAISLDNITHLLQVGEWPWRLAAAAVCEPHVATEAVKGVKPSLLARPLLDRPIFETRQLIASALQLLDPLADGAIHGVPARPQFERRSLRRRSPRFHRLDSPGALREQPAELVEVQGVIQGSTVLSSDKLDHLDVLHDLRNGQVRTQWVQCVKQLQRGYRLRCILIDAIES